MWRPGWRDSLSSPPRLVSVSLTTHLREHPCRNVVFQERFPAGRAVLERGGRMPRKAGEVVCAWRACWGNFWGRTCSLYVTAPEVTGLSRPKSEVLGQRESWENPSLHFSSFPLSWPDVIIVSLSSRRALIHPARSLALWEHGGGAGLREPRWGRAGVGPGGRLVFLVAFLKKWDRPQRSAARRKWVGVCLLCLRVQDSNTGGR